MNPFSSHLDRQRTSVVHPLVIGLLTVPAMLAVLLAHRPWFALTALACCGLVALAHGLRFATLLTTSAALLFLIVWFGLWLWLPSEAALSAALRIVALSALLVTPSVFVNWAVLADTLIERCHVPYRVVDTVLLGERFASLMRADLRLVSHIAKLRARGHPRFRNRLLLGATVPVLVASFRHSDELAIAMDARGFGLNSTRTVHQSQPISALDVAILVAVWGLSIAIALLLERV